MSDMFYEKPQSGAEPSGDIGEHSVEPLPDTVLNVQRMDPEQALHDSTVRIITTIEDAFDKHREALIASGDWRLTGEEIQAAPSQPQPGMVRGWLARKGLVTPPVVESPKLVARTSEADLRLYHERTGTLTLLQARYWGNVGRLIATDASRFRVGLRQGVGGVGQRVVFDPATAEILESDVIPRPKQISSSTLPRSPENFLYWSFLIENSTLVDKAAWTRVQDEPGNVTAEDVARIIHTVPG